MDWINVALAIILGLGLLEGIYLLIKSRRENLEFGSDEAKEEQIVRIKVWDAMKLGFGFCLGVLIFLILLSILVMILQKINLPIPKLPLSIFI